jgi:hypothetical protein
MAVRLSALLAGRPLPPGRFLILISVRGWVDSRTMVRLKELGKLKILNDLIRNQTRDLKVEVTLRLTVSQSACGGVEPTLGLVTRYYFLSESCVVSVGRPLWREVESITCHSQSIVIYQYSHQGFTFHARYNITYIFVYLYTVYIRVYVYTMCVCVLFLLLLLMIISSYFPYNNITYTLII